MSDPIAVGAQSAPFSPEDMLLASETAASPVAAPSTQAPSVDPATSDASGRQAEQPAAPPQEGDPAIVPTEADQDMFMRHVLGMEVFEKEYVLAGGNIRVTLRSRTVVENDEIFTEMRRRVASGEIPAGRTGVTYMLELYRLYFARSVSRIVLGSSVIVVDGTLAARSEQIKKSLNEIQYRILLRQQEDFEALMSVLYHTGLASDFTYGRAPAS